MEVWASGDKAAAIGRRRGAGDEGFSLVEVLVAMVVLLVVLLPVGSLLITSSNVIAASQFRTQAQGIASQELAAVQLAADGQATAFTTMPFSGLPSLTPALVPPTGTGGSVAWNQSATPLTETVDHEQYTVYVDGDWCAVTTTSGAASYTNAVGTTPPESLAFVAAVDVLWDHTTLPTGTGPGTHYVLIGAVQPPGGWTGLPAGGLPASDVDQCPAGLS